jgi:hypothetical protein
LIYPSWSWEGEFLLIWRRGGMLDKTVMATG